MLAYSGMDIAARRRMLEPSDRLSRELEPPTFESPVFRQPSANSGSTSPFDDVMSTPRKPDQDYIDESSPNNILNSDSLQPYEQFGSRGPSTLPFDLLANGQSKAEDDRMLDTIFSPSRRREGNSEDDMYSLFGHSAKTSGENADSFYDVPTKSQDQEPVVNLADIKGLKTGNLFPGGPTSPKDSVDWSKPPNPDRKGNDEIPPF